MSDEELDVDKAISEAHLAASGWGLGHFRNGNPFESHFVYVRDFRASPGGRLRLFSINQSDFQQVTVPASLGPGAVAGALIYLVRRYEDGTISPDEESRLASCLTAYIKSTEGYRRLLTMSTLGDRIHALLHFYPGREASEDSVRPAFLASDHIVVHLDTLLLSSDRVIEMDLRTHPEWFGGLPHR